jgi:hypothetical protein
LVIEENRGILEETSVDGVKRADGEILAKSVESGQGNGYLGWNPEL